jgi:hypothetical protein
VFIPVPPSFLYCFFQYRKKRKKEKEDITHTTHRVSIGSLLSLRGFHIGNEVLKGQKGRKTGQVPLKIRGKNLEFLGGFGQKAA